MNVTATPTPTTAPAPSSPAKAPPGLPELPEVPHNGRGHVEVDVSFPVPLLVDTKLGEIPRDYFSYSSYVERNYTSCDQGACVSQGSEVWRGLPTLDAAGKPQMQTTTRHLVAAPRSMLAHGALWGGVGALAGAAAGTLVSLFAGLPLTGAAATGATAGAALGGGLGAYQASRDRVRLEWKQRNVNDLRLAGYYHTIHERTRQECHWEHWGHSSHYVCHTVHDGWDHDFRADVQATPIGTYYEPVVTHYRV